LDTNGLNKITSKETIYNTATHTRAHAHTSEKKSQMLINCPHLSQEKVQQVDSFQLMAGQQTTNTKTTIPGDDDNATVGDANT